MGFSRGCGIAVLGLVVAGAVWGQQPHEDVPCVSGGPPGIYKGPELRTRSIEAATATPIITVMRDGKAIAGAKIETSLLSRSQEKFGPVLTTDEKGQAVLPRLNPGAVYEVVARFEDDASDELDLQYLPSAREKTDEFRVELELVPDWGWRPAVPGPPSREELITDVTKKGSEEWVPVFRGTVRGGGVYVVPNAAIEVTDRVSGKVVARLQSDQAGRFSAVLPEGYYVAVFDADGYAMRALAFSVTASGVSGELSVRLQLTRPCAFPTTIQ
jgi:hypothetical protein